MNIQVCASDALLLSALPPLSAIRELTSCLPGGKKILARVAGKDASQQFWKYHNEGILKKYKSKLQVGSLDTKKAAAPPTPPATPPAKPAAPPAAAAPAAPQEEEETEPLEPLGDQIPFADPSWYQSVNLPPQVVSLHVRLTQAP